MTRPSTEMLRVLRALVDRGGCAYRRDLGGGVTYRTLRALERRGLAHPSDARRPSSGPWEVTLAGANAVELLGRGK